MAKEKTNKDALAAVNIITADLLITDQIVENLEKYPELAATLNELFAKNGVERGGKISLSNTDFQTLKDIVAKIPATNIETQPGGSTSGIITNFKRLLEGKAKIDFVTVADKAPNDQLTLQDFAKSGINVIATEGESATSYIFPEPNDGRSLATHAGTGKTILKPEMVTQKLAGHNITIIPASLAEKFSDDFVNKLLAASVAQDNQIWVTLPTMARFGDAQDETIKNLIQHADVVVTDEKKLINTYGTKGDFELAVSLLQQDLGRAVSPNHKTPSAFIPRKDNSALVVTPSDRYVIPAIPLPQIHYNSIGADDVAFGAYLAGIANGLAPKDAGTLAAKAVGIKYNYNTIRLPSADTSPEIREQLRGLQGLLSFAFPKRSFISAGERVHFWASYIGIDWIFNTASAVAFAYWAQFSKLGIRIWTNPIRNFFDKILTPIIKDTKKREAGVGYGSLFLSIVMGGMLTIPPLMIVESKKIKLKIIKSLDRLIYGKEKVAHDPKFQQAYKEIEEAPKKDFWTGMLARFAALVPLLTMVLFQDIKKIFNPILFNPIQKGSEFTLEKFRVNKNTLSHLKSIDGKTPWEFFHDTFAVDFGLSAIYATTLHPFFYNIFAGLKEKLFHKKEHKENAPPAPQPTPVQTDAKSEIIKEKSIEVKPAQRNIPAPAASHAEQEIRRVEQAPSTVEATR